jgi:hypothetical protein
MDEEMLEWWPRWFMSVKCKSSQTLTREPHQFFKEATKRRSSLPSHAPASAAGSSSNLANSTDVLPRDMATTVLTSFPPSVAGEYVTRKTSFSSHWTSETARGPSCQLTLLHVFGQRNNVPA